MAQKYDKHCLDMLIRLTLKEIKTIILTSIGGTLEFFEFTIYALFSKYIGFHFFPNKNSATVLIATFSVYALGYLARPLGGILFGHFGDKYGRKNAFSFTVLLMAISTLLIGCLPSYQTIGITAPFILVFLRLVQGLSVGGEISGATVFTAEHLPAKHRGLGIGILFMSITFGNALGGAVGFVLNYSIGNAAMIAWGWRLPFLLGFLLGICSYLIRKNISETPIFEEMEKNKQLQTKPFITLFKKFNKELAAGILLMAISSTMIGFFLYLPTYLSVFLNFQMQQTFLINVISFLILSILTGFFGFLSDYINRAHLALIGCVVMAIISYIGFNFFLRPETTTIYIFICLMAISISIVNGCYALLIVELFPACVRYSGMGASYSIGVAIFGGSAPLIFSFVIQYFHNVKAPYYYLLFCIFLTAIGAVSTRKLIFTHQNKSYENKALLTHMD